MNLCCATNKNSSRGDRSRQRAVISKDGSRHGACGHSPLSRYGMHRSPNSRSEWWGGVRGARRTAAGANKENPPARLASLATLPTARFARGGRERASGTTSAQPRDTCIPWRFRGDRLFETRAACGRPLVRMTCLFVAPPAIGVGKALNGAAQILDILRRVERAVLHFDRGLGPVFGWQPVPGDDGLLQIFAANPSSRMLQSGRPLPFRIDSALTAHRSLPLTCYWSLRVTYG